MCAFPLELARRCIASTTAAVVLDPFMGSGTMAVAAEQYGREWIGQVLQKAAGGTVEFGRPLRGLRAEGWLSETHFPSCEQ